MPLAFLEGCSDSCGWIAAVICVLSFGSFGVPLRGGSGKVEMHPLVMQSYKTLTCFMTCWLVLLLGEDLKWSRWGIASGLFWVPGATCGVYGIQNAGLAIAVGTWSSIIVLTSFFFGVVVFHERVKHLGLAFLAFLCLTLGLMGMSRYAAHQPDMESNSNKSTTTSHYNSQSMLLQHDDESSHHLPSPLPSRPGARGIKRTVSSSLVENSSASELMMVGSLANNSNKPSVGSALEIEMEPLVDVTSMNGGVDDEAMIMGDDDPKHGAPKDHVILLGGRLALTRRQLGVLGAVVNGAWGGLNLVPMHYARKYDGIYGSAYLISFASGALIVNTAMWILFFSYQLYQKKGQWQEALESLPKFHLRELWAPGLAAGLLYSLGNFTAILAVAALGQSIGYPFCQMQLFVSGCWGIFYFKEIKGVETISKWFLSAALALIGIIWLAYEREGSSGH